MSPKVLGIFGRWVLLLILWLACGPASAASISADDAPPNQMLDGRLSTNWFASVRAILPAGYFTNASFDFAKATNGLAQQTILGNLAAQSLWGVALVVSSNSPAIRAVGLKLMLSAAESGDIGARLNLGYLYEGGIYVRRNYDQAFHWFSAAADAGNAEAELQLGACYHYGLGTTPDLAMTAKYYRLSAGHGNFVAMKSLGYVLMNGFGVEKNLDDAKYWFTRAATEGKNRRAMYNLGVLACLKFPETNAMAEAFQWMKQSANLGDPLAAQELANFYYNGWGVVQTNLGDYYYWRSRAAILGATDSQYFMGQASRRGDGVPKDDKATLMWYRKAAAKNHPEALYDLAVMCLQETNSAASRKVANELMTRAAELGHREAQFQCALTCFRDDSGQDCEKGQDWMFKAAKNGWAKAEFCLFQCYFYGHAPTTNCPPYPQDKVEAVKWLRLAAEHGYLQAQSTLGVMLLLGKDVEPDKTAAEKIMRNAANHGFAMAQNDLGYALLHGDFFSMDATEAAFWCQLAVMHSVAPNDLKRAKANLANASAHLTLEEQDTVERRVKKFEPEPVPPLEPQVKDWQKNPEYQQEDGPFGH